MFRTICCTFPFMVCLCWFITFALRTRRNDSAKRMLTVFLAVCTVLYLCHAFYFTEGLTVWGEALWALCSLSVYPLYYIYITHLTCRPLRPLPAALCLLPSVAVALALLLFPDSPAETARQVLFAVQVLAVIIFGYRHLIAFDHELANTYADTEGRDMSAVKVLLFAFVATSMLSAVANIIGKQNVAASNWLWTMLVPFGILLYALSYIGYTRDFSPEQFIADTDETGDSLPSAMADAETSDSELGRRIEELMATDYFLTPNLKVTDLARDAGSCRTYVSNYINKTYNQSFSDYVNSMRVAYAQRLLLQQRDIKMTEVAERSGFSSEQPFYRNFKKFVGMTPAEWMDSTDGATTPSA